MAPQNPGRNVFGWLLDSQEPGWFRKQIKDKMEHLPSDNLTYPFKIAICDEYSKKCVIFHKNVSLPAGSNVPTPFQHPYCRIDLDIWAFLADVYP